MKLFLVGDVCPTASTAPLFQAQDTERLFCDTHSLFDADFCLCNLECAITESENGIEKFGPCLKAPRETAAVLRTMGMDVCGLSNNHIFDFGAEGARDTVAALREAGLAYTGFGKNYEDSRRDYIFEKDGLRVAIIAVCEHEFSYALENRMGSRPFDEFDTLEDVRRAKKTCHRVIVTYHGGKEFCEYPSPRLRRVCRALVRAGADVVLTQHSHCVGCYELYEGGHILYGQGNFHFVKLPLVGPKYQNIWKASLGVHYNAKTHEITFTPIINTEDGIKLAKGEEGREILQGFARRNASLVDGTWIDGWRAFCEDQRENYLRVIAAAATEAASERENANFAHYLDCEAHTDVWRELFPTYNATNCEGETDIE